MASACALAIFSGKDIFNSRLSRPAGRSKRCFHQWGRRPETVDAHFTDLALSASGPALSVIAARCQIPLFVTYGDISPRPGRICPGRGKSFLKGGALGSPHKVHLFAKTSPFGRGGCERSEQTKRARTLPAARMFPQETSAANAAFLHDSTRENAMPDSPQAARHCSN